MGKALAWGLRDRDDIRRRVVERDEERDVPEDLLREVPPFDDFLLLPPEAITPP
jgi:hypothetical protein